VHILFVVLQHIFDAHAFEKSQDTLVDLFQRTADCAATRMSTGNMLGKTVCQDNGSIDRMYDLQGRDATGIACQPIAAIGAVLGNQEAASSELLEQFRKYGERNSAGICDLFCTHRVLSFSLPKRKMLESNQAVVCLLCESEHFVRSISGTGSQARNTTT